MLDAVGAYGAMVGMFAIGWWTGMRGADRSWRRWARNSGYLPPP